MGIGTTHLTLLAGKLPSLCVSTCTTKCFFKVKLLETQQKQQQQEQQQQQQQQQQQLNVPRASPINWLICCLPIFALRPPLFSAKRRRLFERFQLESPPPLHQIEEGSSVFA